MNKPFWKSKINWVAFISVVLGFLADPTFLSFIDPWWAAQLLKAIGVITFILRTWFATDVAKQS